MPDVVVQGEEAYLFYFTHLTDSPDIHDGTERPTSIQVARLDQRRGNALL